MRVVAASTTLSPSIAPEDDIRDSNRVSPAGVVTSLRAAYRGPR